MFWSPSYELLLDYVPTFHHHELLLVVILPQVYQSPFRLNARSGVRPEGVKTLILSFGNCLQSHRNPRQEFQKFLFRLLVHAPEYIAFGGVRRLGLG